MNMVSIPIQRIILHTEIIPRKIPWWVPEIVILIPQNAFAIETCQTFSIIKSVIKIWIKTLTMSTQHIFITYFIHVKLMKKESVIKLATSK